MCTARPRDLGHPAAEPAGDSSLLVVLRADRVECPVRNLVFRADGKMVNVVRKQGQMLVCTG
ncbi:MAG: hypothetical protein ACRDJ9_20515 [Dehalococcoidia bacterium]